MTWLDPGLVQELSGPAEVTDATRDQLDADPVLELADRHSYFLDFFF